MEKLVRQLARGVAGTGPRPDKPDQVTENADILAVQGHLEEFLGLPVRIKSDDDPRSGSVTIKYQTLDQLDMVCQRLTGGDI